MPDDHTGPDLQRIISILFETDEATRLFETIRPLDLPTDERPPPTPPEILAMLEAETSGLFNSDPLPTDPHQLEARLALASIERQHDPDAAHLLRNVKDVISTPDPTPALESITRYTRDHERRKWQDSENLARIAQALDRDPQAVEAVTGQEPPQAVEQEATGRGNKFEQKDWLETLNTWTGLFFGEPLELPDPDNPKEKTGNPFAPPPPPPRKPITRDQFRKRIIHHNPDPIPSLVSLAWSAIPSIHKEPDHLPPDQDGAPWKGTGPARTLEAITRALFELFRPGKPGPETSTQKPTSKALDLWLTLRNTRANRAIWQGIPSDWKHKGRPPATPDKKA